MYSRQRTSEPPHQQHRQAYGYSHHDRYQQHDLARSQLRQTAGYKRKLDALRGADARPPGPAESQVHPAVPLFGAPVIQSATTHPSSSRSQAPAPAKSSLFGLHKWNQPSDQLDDEQLSAEDTDDDDDDDDAEDVDEEAAFAYLGSKLTFEYEGEVIKLSSQSDLAKWQEERRRRWPTDARIADKQSERYKVGLERKRLLEGAYALRQPGFKFRTPLRKHDRPQAIAGPSDLAKASDAPPADGAAVKSTVGLPGMSAYDSDESDGSDGEADPTAAASSEVQQETSNNSKLAEEDDDAPPEAQSTRSTISAPQPDQIRRACKYHFNHGHCKAGDECAYSHEAQPGHPRTIITAEQRRQQLARARKPQESTARKGIHQLLVDQESEAANRLALQVIKYLGSKGFFSEQQVQADT